MVKASKVEACWSSQLGWTVGFVGVCVVIQGCHVMFRAFSLGGSFSFSVEAAWFGSLSMSLSQCLVVIMLNSQLLGIIERFVLGRNSVCQFL